MKLAESRGNMAARLRREGNGDRTSQLREQALRAWQQALHRNPLQGWIWYEMGTALTRMPYDNRGYAASLRHADSAVRQAVEMRPVDPELLYSAARYWLWRSSLSGFAVQDPPDYKRLFRQAVELQSNLWPQVARAVWTATTNTETILECLPQEPVWARRINRWVDKQKTVD
jgi:tetratricopeptide (TPR) repeat protein